LVEENKQRQRKSRFLRDDNKRTSNGESNGEDEAMDEELMDEELKEKKRGSASLLLFGNQAAWNAFARTECRR
jgi:hypothetical protein